MDREGLILMFVAALAFFSLGFGYGYTTALGWWSHPTPIESPASAPAPKVLR